MIDLGEVPPIMNDEVIKQLGYAYESRLIEWEQTDTPEYIWENPLAETYYIELSENLQVSKRVAVLQEGWELIFNMNELMRNKKDIEHSSRLEWIVIILIAVEILFQAIDIW